MLVTPVLDDLQQLGELVTTVREDVNFVPLLGGTE